MAMTFWATLWYAGAVVVSMGYQGQTEQECKKITSMMMADVASAYADPKTLAEIADIGIFPTNKFTATCEKEFLPVDKRYAK